MAKFGQYKVRLIDQQNNRHHFTVVTNGGPSKARFIATDHYDFYYPRGPEIKETEVSESIALERDETGMPIIDGGALVDRTEW